MRGAAGGAEGPHLVIERLPVAGQHVAARDHDVDLLGPGADTFLDLGHAQVERRQPGREPGADGGHGYSAALERADRCGNHIVINADGADLYAAYSQRLLNIRLDRLARLGAEPFDAPGCVVA